MRLDWWISRYYVLLAASIFCGHALAFCPCMRGDYRVPEQKAAIYFHSGVEDLIIQIKYTGEVSDFAWVVPLPSLPAVSVVDSEFFEELRRYTYARDEWRVLGSGYDSFSGFGFGGRAADGLNVHARGRAGVYDIAVLESSSIEALRKWTSDHGFQVTAKAWPVLESYVDRGWFFTAMRVDPAFADSERARKLNEGTTEAVRFTFSTPEAVYPLRISSVNRGATDVLLFVLAEDALVHPAFTQRYPAPLEEFRRYQFAVGTEAENVFSSRFDAQRFTYRPVTAQELPRTDVAFPRPQRRPLYLTALERRFEPEEMLDDIVLKTPESMDSQAQIAYVNTSLTEEYPVKDSLLLRMPNALSAAVEQELSAGPRTHDSDAYLEDLLQLLVRNPGDEGAIVLKKAARHEKKWVRKQLATELQRAWFRQDRTRYAFDFVAETEKCNRFHDEYATPQDVEWPCHYRLHALPNAPIERIAGALRELFMSPTPDSDVAGMLAALGTDEALKLLVSAARGELEQNPVDGLESRRTLALAALRHLEHPELPGLYRYLLTKHRGALDDHEMTCCLVGLWNNPDPSLVPLIQQIGAYCRQRGMPMGSDMARNLLVNRLGTHTPYVEDGMTLARLERELGSRGVVVSELSTGGDDFVRYRWAAGDATVRSGVVVRWRPSSE